MADPRVTTKSLASLAANVNVRPVGQGYRYTPSHLSFYPFRALGGQIVVATCMHDSA